jgi:hypothetical protein
MLRVAYGLCAVALLLCGTAGASEPPRSAVAWFTDAAIADSVRMAAPAEAPPTAQGGSGTAVLLTEAVPVECPVLSQQRGYISFWLKPDWNGNDGKAHRILRIGDPERNGLLVEKSSKNMLRYVMASPEKVTAARADVSHWKAGEWHHVVVVWMDRDGVPIGLPLWIDKTAVDGPIASGNTFLNPAAMDDARIWIGDDAADAGADAVMDELIVRDHLRTELSRGQIDLVYRDYFRSAPFTAIAIDAEPHAVPADRRVVEGAHKQFGLQGRLNGKWERLTEFVSGYGNWTYFDAKPLITWSTSNEKVATVDENGLVTGHAVGRCTLTAGFRGMQASYKVHVIPVEQPDLDLYLVERLPRYSSDDVKWWPEPGETVQSVVHVANAGYTPTPQGVRVTFELIPDTNGNYRLDRGERPIEVQRATVADRLEPLDETTLTFEWTWPDVPVWVRASVDPGNRVREICEANNQLCELNTAHAVRWGYVEDVRRYDHANRRINLTGSFSYYDWLRTESDRIRLMLRDAVYPTTSPDGVLDDIRVDNFFAITPGNWSEEPFETEGKYYDGGFPVGDTESTHLDFICSGLVHELGHTMLALPDLYGYPMEAQNVFLEDDNGRRYTDGPLLPQVTRWGSTMFTSAQNVPCGVGYAYLMDFCHMWLHPAHAGQVQHFAGQRGQRFWGVQGHLIPFVSNELEVYDVNDEPLAGAAVYVYHVINTDARDASTKYFADRPKFVGNTDERGRYVFPGKTDVDWDDAHTDEVDGEVEVWNPFGTAKKDTAFTPNVWGVEGLLLIKIVARDPVAGDQTEFHWLPLTALNEVYFSGSTNRGIYTIRTSLKPCEGTTPIVRRPIPDVIKKTNLAPVAQVDCENELTVQCGATLRIDGSASRDPEEQPLIFRWKVHGPGDVKVRHVEEPVYEGKMPDEPTELEAVFYVIDGLRASEPVRIKVNVVKPEAEDTTTAAQ